MRIEKAPAPPFEARDHRSVACDLLAPVANALADRLASVADLARLAGRASARKASLDDLRTLLPDWRTHLRAVNRAPATIQSYLRVGAAYVDYAIEKGINVFMEKPVTVDGPTTKRMIELAKKADAKNLKVGVGLMIRHCRRPPLIPI